MENYVRAPKQKTEGPAAAENEVRVVASNNMRSYVSYCLTLFQEKNHTTIVIKAMGRAINKTVAIAEVVKRRVEGIHQVTEVSSTDITDIWEPTEPGLSNLEIVRHVSVITITLSKSALDTANPGYQAPLPASMVQPSGEAAETVTDSLVTELEARGGGGGRGRRGRNSRPRRGGKPADGEAATEGLSGAAPDAAASGDVEGGRPKSSRRGRGRGGRGRGRGRRGGRGDGAHADSIVDATQGLAL